ncbi:hypothetical protein KFE25_000710 [Diacronema lutheri]|uniref:Glycosyltransferase 2-like domain-containing protein n=1 Tax=Diacronema lutheri TaxID=2081491 RepID=A0A8J6CCB7_DIALT|nr:hypothetical protein KFE25_000710 [Diacronema lutheri]
MGVLLKLLRAWSSQRVGAMAPRHAQADHVHGPPPQQPTCTVVIPTYNERECVVRTVQLCRRLASRPDLLEVVVVDGGSDDGTSAALERERDTEGSPLRLLFARGGRGCALRVGAQAARGDVILMLHAECVPPLHFDRLCADTLADPTVVLGAFSFRIDRSSFQAAQPVGIGSVEYFANIRSRPPTSLPYGDQGLHVRAADLRAIGGVPAVAIMEDVLLVRRLRAAKSDTWPVRRVHVRAEAVECSGRRWERHGVLRVTMLNQLFMLAHYLGFSPDAIYTAYYGRSP